MSQLQHEVICIQSAKHNAVSRQDESQKHVGDSGPTI